MKWVSPGGLQRSLYHFQGVVAEPGPLEEILFFDHPSGRSRIMMAMTWKAEHLAEAEANARRAAADDQRRGFAPAP